ncbi:MAG: UMP kinase [Candidatus Peribacteraceae bacterium]|nr:UMP kinase [Candidatus Peribacteraceae bacterium]MBP9851057.1 UMP kinase [Candidatus Peribacteraceae bacterium]
MKYKRVLLKISGEALASGFGFDYDKLHDIAAQVVAVRNADIQVVIVVGAGNIWRFRDTTESGIERTASDAMGMLATIMNAVALQSAIENLGVATRVCSAINVPQLAEPYLRRRAERHLEKKRIVICAGGTGNPYFTTDSAAALRALELNCGVILKASTVDGVYDKDPKKFKNAKKYENLTFQEAIEKNLKVFDQSAFSLCREQNLPIIVFDYGKKGAFLDAAMGKKIGTLVKD